MSDRQIAEMVQQMTTGELARFLSRIVLVSKHPNAPLPPYPPLATRKPRRPCYAAARDRHNKALNKKGAHRG